MNVESLKNRLLSRPGHTARLNLRLVTIEGPDAQEFLQGQLTLDLNKLTSEQHQLTAWCNAKGRVWAVLRVWRSEKGFNFLLPSDQTEAFVKRLRMFVLRAKVRIELSELTAQGLVLEHPVDQGHQVAQTESGEILQLTDREAILITREARSEPVLSEEYWTALRILAEEPQITAETQEKFLPQSINLEVLGGLHFNKGCYVGQEIVARVHYKGRAPQRLNWGLNPSPEQLSGTVVLATTETEPGRIVQWVENIRD